jgi:osmoprotectant transport system ATP-binding protein
MIELRELSKRYGERSVVERVSFSVARGERIVIVGGSGSGKTTLLRMINRLVEPTSGQVLIAGEDAGSLLPHVLRRQIGYVFQQLGLFPHLNVKDNICITPRLLGWDDARCDARSAELLELVGLSEAHALRRPAELSGGEQQRVAVARALAAEPKLMLLDEPFGALDPLLRERLQQALLEIAKRLELTLILVTHDMLEALTLADRILVLHAGSVQQIGSPEDILRQPANAYVRDLFATSRRTAQVIERIGGLGGDVP